MASQIQEILLCMSAQEMSLHYPSASPPELNPDSEKLLCPLENKHSRTDACANAKSNARWAKDDEGVVAGGWLVDGGISVLCWYSVEQHGRSINMLTVIFFPANHALDESSTCNYWGCTQHRWWQVLLLSTLHALKGEKYKKHKRNALQSHWEEIYFGWLNLN